MGTDLLGATFGTPLEFGENELQMIDILIYAGKQFNLNLNFKLNCPSKDFKRGQMGEVE